MIVAFYGAWSLSLNEKCYLLIELLEHNIRPNVALIK